MTARDELESRMGIGSLEELLAKRAELVGQVAPLRAKYGPGGTWDALRKATVSTIAMKIRAQATLDGTKKLTEAAADDASHADEAYVALITQATEERAEMMLLDDQIQAINDEIQRGNVLGRFAAAELHL